MPNTSRIGEYRAKGEEFGADGREFGADGGEFDTDTGEFGADGGELGTDTGEFGADTGKLPGCLTKQPVQKIGWAVLFVRIIDGLFDSEFFVFFFQR